MNIQPAKYYKHYIADDTIYPLSEKVLRLIRNENPAHVFEFGCGTGKNLRALGGKINLAGLDISIMNVITANTKHEIPFIMYGNEDHLRHLQDFDCVFTVSVLDHIEKIGSIIKEFKRIANKAVFLAETQDVIDEYYFNHDYEKYGFEKLDFKWVSEGDGATYHIWKWKFNANDDKA